MTTTTPQARTPVHPPPHKGQVVRVEPAWTRRSAYRADLATDAKVVAVGNKYFQVCMLSGRRAVRSFRLDNWVEYPPRGCKPAWVCHPDAGMWASIGPRMDLATEVARRCTLPPVLARDHTAQTLHTIIALLDHAPPPDPQAPAAPAADPRLAALPAHLDDFASVWEGAAERLRRDNTPGWPVYAECAAALRRLLKDPPQP